MSEEKKTFVCKECGKEKESPIAELVDVCNECCEKKQIAPWEYKAIPKSI